MYYEPALMTKNFTRAMPMFLSETNLEILSHLFKNVRFPNKYQKSVAASKKFKKLKFVNQQKTKTQDKLGELSTKEDVKSYLKKEPKEIFANALANFWFKDADKFIQDKKSMYVKKESLWDLNEPTVYDRMKEDIQKRLEKSK